MSRVDRGFFGTDFNLLGEYLGGYEKAGFPDLLEPATHGDCEALARQVQRLDEKVKAWLKGHGIALNVLKSEEELRQFLRQRDPGT